MNNINIIYAKLDVLYENFDRYILTLSESRRKKILSISNFDARVCSLGGALLLSEAALKFGADVNDVLYTNKGKPYVLNQDFYFSISHSNGVAACSFGHIPSGCDIQVKRQVNLKVAERFFSAAEQKKVFSAKDVQDEFFRMWCSKESAYKLTGINDCIIENKHKIFFKEFNVSKQFYLTVCAFENAFKDPEKIEL